ncbi:hypothetical protein UFOVP1475_19 [uncultured Caudovirales phage]|uniref:Uncharacterized protein n=1 Tax=uncultured Caudovirales phage TaxID=2100421 RepID=A0A6J5SM85_9CAUD|nr:hypothetical protein UFOVP1475_19 [uncultured Caudovirales phage]
MQSQSENTNTNLGEKTLWSEDEIRDLILYAKDLQQQNEDLRAKMIMMNAKLENEEAKVRQYKNLINLMTNGTRN